MELPSGSTLLNIALLLIGLAVAWTILRAVFKFTARLFTVGCLVVLAAVAVFSLAGLLS